MCSVRYEGLTWEIQIPLDWRQTFNTFCVICHNFYYEKQNFQNVSKRNDWFLQHNCINIILCLLQEINTWFQLTAKDIVDNLKMSFDGIRIEKGDVSPCRKASKRYFQKLHCTCMLKYDFCVTDIFCS